MALRSACPTRTEVGRAGYASTISGAVPLLTNRDGKIEDAALVILHPYFQFIANLQVIVDVDEIGPAKHVAH